MVAELLKSPTGAIHFGLVIVSGDNHATEILARQVAAGAKNGHEKTANILGKISDDMFLKHWPVFLIK